MVEQFIIDLCQRFAIPLVYPAIPFLYYDAKLEPFSWGSVIR